MELHHIASLHGSDNARYRYSAIHFRIFPQCRLLKGVLSDIKLFAKTGEIVDLDVVGVTEHQHVDTKT